MSWLFSQALVEAFLGENSLDGEPCAQLNVMPTQHPFWRNDKPMDVLSRSPFGVTWKPLTESRGEELLTWYLGVSHARTSAQQDEATESPENDQDSGKKWHASLTKYDPDTCSWRTHQYSLLGGLELYSETWPRWGLMRDGECWEQSMPELRINESESGLLPTPCASDTANRQPPKNPHVTSSGLVKHIGKSGDKSQVRLSQVVKLWPTPKANDPEKRGNFDVNNPRNGLPAAVRKYPTPIARDSRTVKGGGSLNERDWIGTSNFSSSGNGASHRWPPEPDVGRVVNGMANGVDRLKALGNGQVPAVAAMAWKILSE